MSFDSDKRSVQAQTRPRDKYGHFIPSSGSSSVPAVPNSTPLLKVTQTNKYFAKNDPPLIDLKITNPVTYLKLFLKKLLANEGIDFHLKIKPFTVILIVLILSGTGYTLGAFGVFFPSLLIQKTDITVTPTPIAAYKSAFFGTLGKTASGHYYLMIVGSQVVNLEVSANVNLSHELGKRLLASGLYNHETNTLQVTQSSQLEVLPTAPQALPTLPATPTPSSTPLPTVTPSPAPTSPNTPTSLPTSLPPS